MFDNVAPMSDDLALIPAATVLLLRDADTPSGLEVLMVHRNSKIAFGGAWVFPGGRIDDDELDTSDLLGSARRAAVREAAEETTLELDPVDLHYWSYWEPPMAASMPSTRGPRRRFATWFFAAHAPEGEVVVDDGEIHDHAWLDPADAIAKRDRGEIELVPPTWVTLHQIGGYGSSEEALARTRETDHGRFVTRPYGGDPIVLAWAGDAGYDAGDPELSGARHRLVMAVDGWTYERTV